MSIDNKHDITAIELAQMGGKARAEKLSPERRSEIARIANSNRKCNLKIPKATHVGVLEFGDIKISCAVLEDGTRLISQSSMFDAIGKARPGGGSKSKMMQLSEGVGLIPLFLATDNLKPFITNELTQSGTVRDFILPSGGKSIGFNAKNLPAACNVFLEARRSGNLRPDQMKFAERAEIILQGLAQVGIIALVDEATGYQEERAKNDLQKILSMYISEELLPWTMTFPHTFFRNLCKLYGVEYRAGKNFPQHFGNFINKYIYKKLPQGVLEELQRLNPSDQGVRNKLHHRFLKETGKDHLERQIIAITTLMRASKNKEEFDILFTKLTEE